MGQATRTTKLLLDLGNRRQGGANTGKRAVLDATVGVLNEARAVYLDFLLAHSGKLCERIPYYSEQHLEMPERAISANELLSWAEGCTVETQARRQPWEGWNFPQRFPDMPAIYRRSVIKDAIGKVRSYLSSLAHWEKSGKKQGKPGLPGARDHPTLYQGTCSLERAEGKSYFVRLKVYDGRVWHWVNYPVVHSRYFQQRLRDPAWEQQSPTLVLSRQAAALHFPQVKQVSAQKVRESKLDPDLVTVAVDLNVKQLAVITVRQHEQIIETVFVSDAGLDQQRYRHLRRIAKKQWQSGKPVKGERSNQQLWRHVHRMNEDAAHKVARSIANVCARYPGCVRLFERLPKIRPKPTTKPRRINRNHANTLRVKINQ